MPMGVASMSCALTIPGASMDSTCVGRPSPLDDDRIAGTRLSRTIVVFPDPEAPVTATSLPFGILRSSGCTVCIPRVLILIVPFPNITSSGALSRTSGDSEPERNGPIRDDGFRTTSSTVPSERTVPPLEPAPGPISTILSQFLSTRTSWSTMTTVLPPSRRSSTTPSRPSTFDGWSPIEGSSRT